MVDFDEVLVLRDVYIPTTWCQISDRNMFIILSDQDTPMKLVTMFRQSANGMSSTNQHTIIGFQFTRSTKKYILISIHSPSRYKCVLNNWYQSRLLRKHSNHWKVDLGSTHGQLGRFLYKQGSIV
jgi:hypothetical protein